MVPLSQYQAEGDSMAEDKVIIKEGIISQSLSGFYSVRSEGQTYVTSLGGIFATNSSSLWWETMSPLNGRRA